MGLIIPFFCSSNLFKLYLHFIIINKPQTMNRMNLDQVINYFKKEGKKHDVNFFESMKNEPEVVYFKSMESEPQLVDGYIDYEFVKRYCSSYSEKMWRKLQADVVTLWDCNF